MRVLLVPDTLLLLLLPHSHSRLFLFFGIHARFHGVRSLWVLSFITSSTLFRSFLFAVCERAVLKENTHITNGILMNAEQTTCLVTGNCRRDRQDDPLLPGIFTSRRACTSSARDADRRQRTIESK